MMAEITEWPSIQYHE